MNRRLLAPERPARWEPPQITDLDPQPMLQRRGEALPPHTRSVAHPTRWDNPRLCASDRRSRAAAVAEYAVWIAGHADLLAAARNELAGMNLACYCPLDQPCHRDVLLDIANPPANALGADGRAMGTTLRRPWASLLLVPHPLGGKNIENRSWGTDYRGPVAILAGTRIDDAGRAAAAAARLDPDWHTAQSGWLGVAVLIDVHLARGRCCAPWGYPARAHSPRYHWVFDAPARLALKTRGRGFPGLRPVSWSVLVRRSALHRPPHTPASPPPGLITRGYQPPTETS
ncbi:DUF4326 domain-containing protein [Mycobacterium kansasii]